jgi:hypothetical protein
VNANVIIGEEAAFINKKLFLNILVPLFLLGHTVIICITTRSDEIAGGWFDKMINKPGILPSRGANAPEAKASPLVIYKN